MSEQPAVDEPLDFQHAQFDAPPPALACAHCKHPLVARYFSINGEGVCATCLQRAKRAQRGSFSKAFILGSGAGILGALLFSVLMIFTNAWGLFTILIGIAVGLAVRMGAGASESPVHRWLAVATTWVSMSLIYVPVFLPERSFPLAVWSALRLPFILARQADVLSTLIFAFGLWAAYQLSAPRPFIVEGPFESRTAKP